MKIRLRMSKLLLLSTMSAAATMHAQQTAVASSTLSVVVNQTSPGTKTTPWATVLKTDSGPSDTDTRSLVAAISAVTGIFSEEQNLSQNPQLYSNTGIQARVLIDCTSPCNPSANNVPAQNLATPGVVTFDQSFHFIADQNASTLSATMQAEGGAHSFSFYKTGQSGDNHVLLFQVRFLVDASAYPSGLALTSVKAAVGARTMVLTSLGLQEQDN